MSYNTDPYQQQYGQGWEQQGQPSPYGQPYGQSGYGQQGYGGMQPHGGYYGVEPENPGPGRTALIMSLIALGLGLGLAIWGALAYVDIIHEVGTEFESETLPDHLQGKLLTVGLTVLGQIVPTVLGIISLVLAGRAMGKRGSKGSGGFALAIALAAPVICFVVFMAILIPEMPS